MNENFNTENSNPIENTLNDEKNPYSPIDFQEKQRDYTNHESAFAWICLIAGYVFCRTFPAITNPLGAFVFTLFLFAFTFAVLIVSEVKFKISNYITAVSALLTSLIPLISANSFLSFFAFSYSLATYFYFVYSATGNTLKSGFSNLIIADYFKALLVLPFTSIDALFKAMFSGKKFGKQTLKIIAGLFLAVIPTTAVIILLSYDSEFSRLLDAIFNFNLANIFSHIGSLIIGIPIGMYFFGLFVSAVDKKCKDMLTANSCENIVKAVRKVPEITAVSATIPLLLVYILFFISQWQYFISGFTKKLPENFSYAEYAREGFFQLCIVAIINLIIIASVIAFMKRSGDGKNLLLKVLSIVFSAFTLILISTAIAKMIMYIDIYGLTQKRVYATFLMIVLTCIFVMIILLQFIPKIKIIPISLIIVITLFTTLGLINVDRVIAKYNVDCYLSDKLATVDVDALDDLGDSAIPEMVRLFYNIKNEAVVGKISQEDFNVYSRLNSYLSDYKTEFKDEDQNIFEFNLPHYLAKRALKNYEK